MDDEREEEKERERERERENKEKNEPREIKRNGDRCARLTRSRSFLIKYNCKGQVNVASRYSVRNFRKFTFAFSSSTFSGPVRYFRDIHLTIPYSESSTFERDLGKLFQSATFPPRFVGVVAVRHNIERLPTISIIFEDSWK